MGETPRWFSTRLNHARIEKLYLSIGVHPTVRSCPELGTWGFLLNVSLMKNVFFGIFDSVNVT